MASTSPGRASWAETSPFGRLAARHERHRITDQPEPSLFPGILTNAENEYGIANLPEDDRRRDRSERDRDRLAARPGQRLLPISDSIVRLECSQ